MTTPTPHKGTPSTASDKATAACLAYAGARAEIKRLTNSIGDALAKCPLAAADEFGHFGETHLKQAYGYDEGDRGERVYLSDYPEEFQDKLAECSHCAEAHRLVQARKAAKQRYGVAKRNVLRVGRAIALADADKGVPQS